MALIGGAFGYRLLRALFPGGRNAAFTSDSHPQGEYKIRRLLGEKILEELRGKVVVDFGCGRGEDSIELAKTVASRVIGVDIQEESLESARQRASEVGVTDRVSFCKDLRERAEAIISIDAFEHFAEPQAILGTMASHLDSGGKIFISFGPTWYHPYGGHLFSVFPWAHLIFSERSLVRWRADFKDDGATRFSEVAGGLNQMTIARFVQTVEKSNLRVIDIETVPIRRLRWLHFDQTREFTTAIVRAILAK